MANIGIDLGTCFSCVGVCRSSSTAVDIVANAAGNRSTPSFVAFASDDEVLVGDAAKSYAARDAANTVFDVKRMIGRRFDDEALQRDAKRWPFKVVPDSISGAALIEVTPGGGRVHRLLPEQVSAVLLRAFKADAEALLGERVVDAVITVPAYFGDAQRRATLDAARLAGFDEVRLLNEPTAAAIAFRIDRFAAATDNAVNVLVFDVGGGTFDVSLLAVSSGAIEVKATAGNTHLGGEDFDDRMVDFVFAAFKRAHSATAAGVAEVSPAALLRLRTQCERAKRTLSSAPDAVIVVDAFWRGVDLRTTITRARFEALIADYVAECRDVVDQVLRDAGVGRDAVDDVLLVGGSTRIPKLRRMLSDAFGASKLFTGVDADEAVAVGAALYAARRHRAADDNDKGDAVLRDVMPLSVGVACAEGDMVTLAPRNTPIPMRRSARFTTSADGQTRVAVHVFEGERPRATDNTLLGAFVLEGIEAAPRGVAHIDVVFDVNDDGVLSVSATERRSGRSSAIRIAGDRVRLSKDEVDAILTDAEQFRSGDDALRKRIQARSALHGVGIAALADV